MNVENFIELLENIGLFKISHNDITIEIYPRNSEVPFVIIIDELKEELEKINIDNSGIVSNMILPNYYETLIREESSMPGRRFLMEGILPVVVQRLLHFRQYPLYR